MLRRWEAFLDALAAGEGEPAVAAAQHYLQEWERVFREHGPSGLGDQVSDELEFHDHLQPAGEETYIGAGGMERLRSNLVDAAPPVQTTVESVQRSGERILALGHGRPRGGPRGPGRFSWGVVWTVRDRRIVRVDQFGEHAAARAHAGLEG